MSDPTLCDFLPWDTDHFGLRIGRVNRRHLTEVSVQEIVEWQNSEAIECLYFLADFDDPETARLAQAYNFQLVDIRITLEWTSGRGQLARFDPDSQLTMRSFQPADIPILAEIARESHTDTRFFFDQNFPRDKSEALYEVWIRHSCEGLSDRVVTACVDGQVAGYIVCKILDDASGQIGLVGVAEQSRGKGVGKSLVNAALDWFAGRNIRSVQVVTQGRNIAAQRLYQKCGFATRSVQLWYHRWASV